MQLAEETKDVMVENPDTHERINVSNIIRNLPAIYSTSKDEFYRQIDKLNDCITYSDTLEKQVKLLGKQAFNLNEGISQKFKDQLEKVSMYGLIKKERYRPISTNFKDLYLQKKSTKGITLLADYLDNLTGGLQIGTVCTIAGAPGCMKTTYSMNIAYQALKDGKNVCYLTLEETPLSLYSKLLSRVSVDINRNFKHDSIIKNELDEQELTCLFEEIQPYLEKLPGKIHILGEQDLPNYELTSIENRIKEVDSYIKEHQGKDCGIDLLIIDHIQLLKYAVGSADEYKLLNIYVNFFRKMALSFLNQNRQIAIILLSQVNREGMAYAQKHNGNYLMQHLGEASEIERASSYIITTYNDAKSQITNLFKVGAIKLRGAKLPSDTINVFADGAYYQAGDIVIPKQRNYSSSDIVDTASNISSDDVQIDDNVDTFEGMDLK